MYEFTTENITDAVIERMSTTPDPRLREIMACLVQHLHDFAREMKLTPDEWMAGIQFLTRIGHITTPVRQEFVLLSDTLGLSTLINTLHDRTAIEDATHTSLLGPFYREDAPELPLGSSISKKDKSQPVCLWGKITNVDGEPLKNAKVTVWQTASDGSYDLQQGDGSDVDYRGVFHTDENGTYYLKSVRAKGYYIPMDGPVGDMIRAQKREGCRPAHIHFLISAPGYRELSPRSISKARTISIQTRCSVRLPIWWRRKSRTIPRPRSRAFRASISTSRYLARPKPKAPAVWAPIRPRSLRLSKLRFGKPRPFRSERGGVFYLE